MLKPLIPSVLLGLLLSLSVQASSLVLSPQIPISVNAIDAQAVDLLENGKRISRDRAAELKRRGDDISQLEPIAHEGWGLQANLALADEAAGNYPADGAELRFKAFLPNALNTSFMLGSVSSTAGNFQMYLGIEPHTALMQSALLRALGYPVVTPKFVRQATLLFDSLDAREAFINGIADKTRADPKRWIVAQPENEAKLTVQDFVLEPAQINTPPYHWGVIAANRIQGRRSLRGLIAPLVLLDLDERVNLYAWEAGKFVNEAVVLTHPFAESFAEATYDDVRWMTRRIARLSRENLAAIVALGKYPDDIAALLIEKVVARRNHLIELFGLKAEFAPFEFRTDITQGAVVAGRATQEIYPGYGLRFTRENPKAPLRKDEIGRYLLMEGIADGMLKALSKVNAKLQVSDFGDLIAKHQTSLIDSLVKHLQSAKADQPFEVPVGVWGGPLVGAGIGATRNVVAGGYYGGESKVSLVDNLGMQASVGFFASVDGMPKFIPGVSGNVRVARNYVHVRPVTDMKQAVKADWRELLVPRFMGGLGSMLSKGAPDQPESPEELGARVEANLASFLEELKEGEMFIVSDSVLSGIHASATIPLTALLDAGLFGFDPYISMSAGTNAGIVRRTTFLRTKDGVQVYLQRMNSKSFDFRFTFNWWIDIFQYGVEHKQGRAKTAAYLLDRETMDASEKVRLAVALKALLKHNDSELLEAGFGHHALDHETKSKITNKKFLWMSEYGIEESHQVRVRPPANALVKGGGQLIDPAQYERTLFSHRIYKSKGSDLYSFLSDVIDKLAPGFGPQTQSGPNPANAFLGSGKWQTITTEAELTPGRESRPVTILEQNWGGWMISRDALLKILDGVETKMAPLSLERPLIQRAQLATAKRLQLYNVASLLILYKPAVEKIQGMVMGPAAEMVSKLITLNGVEEMRQWCARSRTPISSGLASTDPMNNIHAWRVSEGGKLLEFPCVKPWMKELYSLRRKMEEAGQEQDASERGKRQIKLTTQIIRKIENNLDLVELLKSVGKENYFFQLRLTGFRTGDEWGDSDYVSSSIGMVEPKEGAGIFRDFANKYGIMEHELHARYLSEGF